VRCHRAGAHVALSYRREQMNRKSIKYWLLPEINGWLDSGQMTGYFLTQPVAITPTHVTLTRIGDSLYGNETFDAPADFVLLMTGYEADMKLFRLAGIELRGSCHNPVYNPMTMQTTSPGIYVAGTAVAGTQDKYRVFIENCHVHVARIVADLTGSAPPPTPAPLAAPES
jgi:thioredoxin reductase (NADPH)